MTGLPDVRPGQVWADNDKRCAGRHVKVLEVTGQFGGRPWSVKVQPCNAAGAPVEGRVTWNRLDRFRPTATGYRLVQDVGVSS